MSTNTPVVAKKAWYTSKIVWGSVLVMILDIAQHLEVPEHTPQLTIPSIATFVVAICIIIARVWFTNQPLTEKAQTEAISKTI
jgi:hypothetical protein